MKKLTLTALLPVICILASCAALRDRKTDAHSERLIESWGWGNTPGVTLLIEEVGRTRARNLTTTTYRLRATGYAPNKTYNVWRLRVGDAPKIEVKGLHANNLGHLVSNDKNPQRKLCRLEDILFHSVQNALGEPVKFALISEDQTVRAYASAIPFPIETKGPGSCRLWAELSSRDGQMFTIRGEGFEANDTVKSIATSGGGSWENTTKVSATGEYRFVVAPAIMGMQSDRVTYSVSGKNCTLTVNFGWGPPALRSQ